MKWSDRPFDDAKEIRGILELARTNKLILMPLVTAFSRSGIKTMNGIDIEFAPTSLHCYTVGRNTLERSR